MVGGGAVGNRRAVGCHLRRHAPTKAPTKAVPLTIHRAGYRAALRKESGETGDSSGDSAGGGVRKRISQQCGVAIIQVNRDNLSSIKQTVACHAISLRSCGHSCAGPSALPGLSNENFWSEADVHSQTPFCASAECEKVSCKLLLLDFVFLFCTRTVMCWYKPLFQFLYQNGHSGTQQNQKKC